MAALEVEQKIGMASTYRIAFKVGMGLKLVQGSSGFFFFLSSYVMMA